MKQIGFVILSHNNPQQLLRLVRCLQRIYNNPPIVCHHDFGQCPLRREDFPSDVRFVSPFVKTRWAQFSVVSAALRAIELLYQHATPDWFTLLSGVDYPTMRPEQVIEELTSSEVDAFIDFREVPNIPYNLPYVAPGNPTLQHFTSSDNLELARRRYIGLNIWFPVIRRGPRLGRYTVYLPVDAWRWRFGSQFKCYYGDHWLAGSRKAAEVLIHPTSEHIKLRRYLRFRVSPDECYYQTVLANTPGLRISTKTKRFARWNGGGAHPKILGLDDLPAIMSSEAHFARKFSLGSSVLDEIDRMLL